MAMSASGTRATVHESSAHDADEGSLVGRLRVIGGLLALVAGLVALVSVLLVAKWMKISSSDFTQLAAGVVGVIGSVVGAYFGVKVGSEGTQKVLENQREQAARAQIFAAHLEPNEAKEALRLAFPEEEQAPEGTSGPSPPGR
jgi:hypothetical protein